MEALETYKWRVYRMEDGSKDAFLGRIRQYIDNSDPKLQEVTWHSYPERRDYCLELQDVLEYIISELGEEDGF